MDFTRNRNRGRGLDGYGHGTHIAGIVAGAGAATGARKTGAAGMAPGAHLINLRVLDDSGAGQVADVVEAIDWAIDNRVQYNIRIINLSLGTPVTQSYRDDPMGQAVERAVKAGIVVVASAGNRGETADGKTVLGEHQLARQLALRHHGGRAARQRHGRPQRRHAGAVELARTDGRSTTW